MKIYFKNGDSVEISQKRVNVIMEMLTKPGGCGQFQCFSLDDDDENVDVDLIINLHEVTAIK